jgi:hypothetical protein
MVSSDHEGVTQALSKERGREPRDLERVHGKPPCTMGSASTFTKRLTTPSASGGPTRAGGRA